MDFDTLKRVQDAVALIRSGKLDTLAPGRHELPDGAYVNVFGYQTKESGIYEAHRKYIDIHYVLEGSEIIMVAERYTKQGLIGPLFSTGLYFLVFNGVLTLLLGWVERRMDYFRA